MSEATWYPKPADLYFQLVLDASRAGLLTDKALIDTLDAIEIAVERYAAYVTKQA